SLLVRTRSGRAGRGADVEERLAARIRRDPRVRTDVDRRWRGPGEDLSRDQPEGAARSFRGAPSKPVQALEARRCRYPRAQALERLRGRGRRYVQEDRLGGRSLDDDSGGSQALRESRVSQGRDPWTRSARALDGRRGGAS